MANEKEKENDELTVANEVYDARVHYPKDMNKTNDPKDKE